MTKGTFKALLSERYQNISAAILKAQPDKALLAQEVAAMLREARQAETVILAGMVAATLDDQLINSLESWEKTMADEAVDIFLHPEHFKMEKIEKGDESLKTPSREASDIAACLLTVTLRQQLERDIRNSENSSGPESFGLPFYSIGKSRPSPYEAEQRLEEVFNVYHDRLLRLWQSPLAQNLHAYLHQAMWRCGSEPAFTYNERPVFAIRGGRSKGVEAKAVHIISRAGFYCYWDKKADILYVSCRRSWSEALSRFMAFLTSACPNLQITRSRTVKFTDCDWHVEPVHSYEWVKVYERQKFQQLIASPYLLNPFKVLEDEQRALSEESV